MTEVKCPICEYPINKCQCRYGGKSHPERTTRRRVVLDHLYLLSEDQIRHIIELEKFQCMSYTDPEMNEIFEELKGGIIR